MQAIQFNAVVPRYLIGRALGPLSPYFYWSGISCTSAVDVPEVTLPGPDWVKIQTSLGGICGTDTGTIQLSTSPYLTPFSSSPFTFGHENVGVICETGPETPEKWKVGDRVVVNPLLWCRPRGFKTYCEFCERGEINRCARISDGIISPGVMIGFCKDTGGSWSSHFTAHSSQLYHLPDAISDENAVMIEPFAVGIRAALLANPEPHETILIVGAGTIGLATLAALRASGFTSRIISVAKYDFQAAEAVRLGATEIIVSQQMDVYQAVEKTFGGVLRQPILGKQILSGGADVVIDCVGSDSAIDDALRFTKTGGRFIMTGLPGMARGIDWSSIFSQELNMQASLYYSNAEPWQSKLWESYDLAIHFLKTGAADFESLITHRYKISEYKKALMDSRARGRSKMIKGVFEF